MRRRVVPILIVLLMGAALNVLLAWRCALVARTGSTDVMADAGAKWTEYVMRQREPHTVGPGWGPPDGRVLTGTGGTWLLLSRLQEQPSAYGSDVVTVCRTGWPLRALEGHARIIDRPGLAVQETRTSLVPTPGWSWLPDKWERRSLPVGVLPFGFAANTACFAILSGVAWALIRRIGRRARLDRGLCPWCSYPVARQTTGTLSCTECGRAYDHAMHARPKQVLRAWMTPLLMPQAMLGFIWFVYGMDWLALRFTLRFDAPVTPAFSTSAVAIQIAWLAAIAWRAYGDRSRSVRAGLTIAISMLLATTGYGAMLLIVIAIGR